MLMEWLRSQVLQVLITAIIWFVETTMVLLLSLLMLEVTVRSAQRLTELEKQRRQVKQEQLQLQ